MQLRVRHRAGLEPAVQYFFDPPISAFLARDAERQRIDVFAMQVVNALPRVRFEFVE
jgi:hypothetical protein